jgi:hypothetical protein
VAGKAPTKIRSHLDPSFPTSDPFLRAIGRLVAESALLESQIDELIWYLLGTDRRTGEIVTADLDFRKKVALATSLLRHRGGEKKLREALADRLGRLQNIYDERNSYVHGMYWGGDVPAKRALQNQGNIQERVEADRTLSY